MDEGVRERLLAVLRPEPSEGDTVPVGHLTRRRFAELLGASLALAGLEGCTKVPPGHIVPYVQRPPEVRPGSDTPYATTMVREGYGVGLLALSREGRPIRIEGHPEHPSSLGGTGIREQASVLGLYDPDRAQTLHDAREPRGFDALRKAIGPGPGQGWSVAKGEGLHLLLERTSSPLVGSLLDRLRARYPRVRVWFAPGFGLGGRWDGAKRAFGRVAETQIDFALADVVVSLDSDFLTAMPASLRWARQFATRRAVARPEDGMSRVYAVEPELGLSGVSADHRVGVRARDVPAVAAALLVAVADAGGAGAVPASLVAQARSLAETFVHHGRFVRAAAHDLMRARGRSVVVMGDRQPPEAHALVHALNTALSSFGGPLGLTEAGVIEAGEPSHDITGLLDALDAGAVDTLVTMEANPAYTLPPELRFSERVHGARERVVLSLHEDETAADATWFVPAKHYLESWGDARAWDGTVSFVQPLIRPLYGGRSVPEMLSILLGEPWLDDHQLLRRSWAERVGAHDPERALEAAVRTGIVAGSAFPPITLPVSWSAVADGVAQLSRLPRGETQGTFELCLGPDRRIEDGRFANNAWLQEAPEPITKTVWDNALLMAPVDAKRLGVGDGDVVEARHGDAKVRVPVWVERGQTPGTLGAWLGFGRRRGGRVARGVGVDMAPLRSLAHPHVIPSVTLHPTGQSTLVVTVQHHGTLHGRPIVLRRTLDDFAHEPHFAEEHDRNPPSIQPERLHGSPQWGMTIDLTRAPAAAPASSPARPRTTCRWSARRSCKPAARCTGCASTATTSARTTSRASSCSRCSASTARRRPASTSARSTPPCTAPTASTR